MNKHILKNLLLALGSGVIFFSIFWLLLAKFFAGSAQIYQSVHIGPITIQCYGLVLAIAALAGYMLAMYRRNLYNVSAEQADNLIFTLIIGGFIGARLYHVVTAFSFYVAHPLNIFEVWNGGLSIYGAFIGGALVVWWYCKKHLELSFWNILDWLVPSLALGQVIGRFGNFVNYEIYGNPTNLPWKMFVPAQFRVAPFQIEQYFHPLFLYESAICVSILVLLLRLRFKPGALFLTWLFLYNLMRFLLEQIRVGSTMYGNLRINGIISLLFAALAVVLYFKYVKPESYNSPGS